MKKTLFIAVLVGLMSCIAPAAAARKTNYEKGLGNYTLRAGGMERSFYLYLPENLPDNAPLVFVLHGYGGRANPERYGFNAVADAEGFAVCYPQGAKDGRGKTCWNVGYPFQSDLATDDVGFLCRLARHLQKECGLSRHDTFCTGMSNGGEMCYLLAYLKPDVFAAVAPVAGLTLEWMYRKLKARKGVPLFEIHGTEDRTSEWTGDPTNKGGWGAYVAVPLAVGYWAAANCCTHEITEEIPVKDSSNGHRVIAHQYVGGVGGNEVWLYEIVNGKHSWGEKDIDTAAEVWRFFRCYVEGGRK